MAKSVVSYDKALPEIPDRLAHLEPTSHLRRVSKTEFEIAEGRRPSQLLLVNRLRRAVGEWRNEGYPGASEVSRRLLTYWFEEDHLVDGRVFRFYFGQREAMETVVYLTEVAGLRDSKELVDRFGEVPYPEGAQRRALDDISHQTTADGTRQVVRYVPEGDRDVVQDLPAEDLRRWAVKMATGSGKTVTMAQAIVWSYFHRRMVPGSDLSTNFLVLAPNVIVYQRLEKDFGSNRIFHELPLIPPEWRGQWSVKVVLRGDNAEPDRSGNLFLTNIQQVYEARASVWTPANAVELLLGRKPVQNLASQGRSMLERIKGLPDLVVCNDEAHHVHDQDLEWHKTLMAIHQAMAGGLSLWLDFSATPKDENGTYFPWVICDYPLAQAVEDRIVKAPLIVHRVRHVDPPPPAKGSAAQAYSEWLETALARWRVHYKTYSELGPKPVLFVMTETTAIADEIGEWLVSTPRTHLRKGEVLVIHTDREGDVTQKGLEKAREAVRDIDAPGNKVKVIVSVLMLREGWDVRNVSVVLGLRPFTSNAQILPEQAVGRGLRLMEGVSPDRTQTLEVMGTAAFEEFVRRLETEGVGVPTVGDPPLPPVRIEALQERAACDIAIPLTKPIYVRNYRRLAELDPLSLVPVYEASKRMEAQRIGLKMEFATTETEVHATEVGPEDAPLAEEVLAAITQRVQAEVRLTGCFAELYPLVQEYVRERCFSRRIDLEDPKVRRHIGDLLVQDEIAKYLAATIGTLTAETRAVELEQRELRLLDTRPFTWRRNLPLPQCARTVFNYVATFNDYEQVFARFLDDRRRCPDILRFAALGTTEQDSGSQFWVDYLKPSGAIGRYYPDWVAVQHTDGGEVGWIVETKGRVWEGTEQKDAAISEWCRKVSEQTGQTWQFLRVNQTVFGRGAFRSFQELVDRVRGTATDGAAQLQM